MLTFIAIAGLMFAAGSFVYDALSYHRKDRKGPTTTAPDHAQPPTQSISWPELAHPPQSSPRPQSFSSIKQQPRWVFVSAWIMAGVIILGELVGLVNPGHELGWLGLSAAGAGLAVAVPLVIRLDRTADEDYIAPVIGFLFWALVVLVIRGFFPDWTLLEITWPGGGLRL
ncbi:hypothetical protein AB0F17_50555 [Nonomuraea sp. NPDC026600]|uniref:hypothetical protein n=1 Tax=Nonomuraea sp. NPDC026600 TaxID=3155363 RepID=UPI0033FE8EDD